MDPRIASACAAFIPAALGLGLVSLFIDGRINATVAIAGVLLLVFLGMLMVVVHAERRPRRRPRRFMAGIRDRFSRSRSRTGERDAAGRFATLHAAASQRIREKMNARNLHEAEGWRITESVREIPGGREVVLRPLHIARAAPAGLECVVRIDEATGRMTHECRCEAAPTA